MNELDVKLVYKKEKEKCEEYINKCHLEKINELCINNEIDGVIKHTLIEGENLLALHLLEKDYKNKIDVVYIDPPYNTGNNKFKYKDNFRDKTKGIRHSKWLNMMDKRLTLAKKLLSDKGIIFISIDDNEQAYLKILCDEIFGEENFLNLISIKMKNIAGASGGGQDKKFKKNCEYILIYTKNYDMFPLLNSVYDYEEISDLVKRYKEENKSWKYTSVFLSEGEKEYITSTVDGDGNEIKIFKHSNYVIKSIASVAKEKGISEKDVYYNYSKRIIRTTMPQSSIRPRVMAKLQEMIFINDLISIEYVPKTGKNKGVVYTQYYKGDKYNLIAWLSDVMEEKDGQLYKKTMQGTYWDFTPYINNLTKEGDIEFNNGKKPIELLKRIIGMFPQKNITVLDFFAGSGTTGHAVMKLNSEDGGNRKFILVTNNENNIATNITRERLYRVINGKGSNGEDFEWEYSKDKKCLKNNAVEYMRIVND